MSRYSQWVDKNLVVKSRMGSEWLVLCPFHVNANTPSCCVNVAKGMFVCYSCGEKGNIKRMSEKLNRPLTMSFNAEDIRISLAKFSKPEEVAQVYSPEFLQRFKSGAMHPYWLERGLSKGIVSEWRLGYDQRLDAVTIPIMSVHDEVLGVIRRFVKNPKTGPRYLYPKGFKISWHLFGANKAHASSDKSVLVITEGSIDCLSVWQAGMASVALLGAQLHAHQLTVLSGLGYENIVLFLDRDDAGVHATMKAAAQLTAEGYDVKIAKYPRSADGKDPASLNAADRVRAVEKAIPYMTSRIEELRVTIPTVIRSRIPRR